MSSEQTEKNSLLTVLTKSGLLIEDDKSVQFDDSTSCFDRVSHVRSKNLKESTAKTSMECGYEVMTDGSDSLFFFITGIITRLPAFCKAIMV